MAALGCVLPFVLLVIGGVVGAWVGGAQAGTIGLLVGFGIGCLAALGLLFGMQAIRGQRE